MKHEAVQYIDAAVSEAHRQGFLCVSGGKICVLVLDDDVAFLTFMERALSHVDSFDPICLKTVEDAEAVYKPELFAIVLVDLYLSDSGGMDESKNFILWLRKLDPFVEIIVCTGNYYHCSDITLLQCVDGFIEKPFTLDILFDKLLHWVVHYRQRREQYTQSSSRFYSIEKRLSKLDVLHHQIDRALRGMGDG